MDIFTERTLNLDDLKEWLRSWGDGELAEFAKDEDFVRMLFEKTEGMPLYARYLLDELVELKKRGGDVRAVLERKPKGLREYVREQVRELASLVKNEVGVRKMLALLSVAKGAMRGGEIEELTGLSVWDLDGLPVAVTRWFSVGKEGEERTYAFAHPLLAEEFKAVLGKEAEEAERELVGWCMGWKGHKSVYALRHLAEHLRERKDGRLYKLARNEEFERVQRKVLPYEPDLPLKTLQLSLEAAIDEENPELMAEMVLRHARKVEEGETPVEALRRWGLERAIGLARQRMERDYKVGTLWFLLLAVDCEARGDREGAKMCLNEIKQWWEGKVLVKLKEEQSKIAASLLSELGGVEGADEAAMMVLGDDESQKELSIEWAKRGKFKKALKLADRIGKAREHSTALKEIAKAIGEAGKFEEAVKVFEEAIKTVERIKYAEERSSALSEIVEAMTKVGIFEEALKVARRIEGVGWPRSEVLEEIVTEMAKVGRFEEALKIVERWGILDHLRALSEIAKAMAKAGRGEEARKVFEEALKSAGRIEDAWERSRMLGEIAKAMAKAGRFEEALKLAGRIEDAWRRSEALEEIAKAMVEEGKFEEVMKLAEEIEDEEGCSCTLREIAKAMAEAGKFEEAVKTAERIKNTWDRSEALREIAKAMAKAGSVEEAVKVFEEAVKIAEGIEDARERSETLRERIDEEESIKEVLRIEETKKRSEALIEIAKAMVKTGRVEEAMKVFEEAVKLANGIKYARERLEALIEIAKVMAKMGMVEESVRVAEWIEDTRERLKALREIAKVIAKIGRFEEAVKVFEEAVKVVEKIKDEMFKECSQSLKEIAKAMAEARMFEEAIKFVDMIEDKKEHLKALVEIAKVIAQIGMTEKAKEILEEVIKFEGVWIYEAWIYEELWCLEVLSEIAKIMAQIGMIEKAKEIFEEIIEVTETLRDSWEHLWVLSEIAEAMAQSGMLKEARKVFKEAVKIAWRIEDSCERSKALSEIAEAMAQAGMVKEAMEVAQKSGILWRMEEVTQAAAESGFSDFAVSFSQSIAGEREKLSGVLDRLVEVGSKEEFLRLLPLCGWTMVTALAACACLIRFYPSHAKAIADIVLQFVK